MSNLGLLYRGLGRVEQARQCLAKALAIFEEIKSPYAEQTRQQLNELGG